MIALKTHWDEKFDYIIGNPPYLGHKKLDKEYKKFLMEKYRKVYRDKSDLYYCFYQKTIELLNEDGIVSIITPRYFLESPSGRNLRNYIKDNSSIKEIVDFLGCKIFKNIGISSCISTLNKRKKVNNKVQLFKIKNQNIDINKYRKLLQGNNFENFILIKIP